MEISKKYVIFKTKPIVNNSDYLALEEVSFDDWTTNAFDTEEDAIAKIVEKEWTYEDFYILKRVYITT